MIEPTCTGRCAVIPQLIEHLRALDKQQYETDEMDGAEIAWYYYRDGIEDILGLQRGTLDTAPPDTENGE